MNWLQHWNDVLFLHFPASAAELAAQLPPRLEIDTYDGQAWLSYVFFRLKLRSPWLPFIPGCSSLLELNVRTYVQHREQPGIYFLRMYADNRLAILVSRWLTPLCYEPAAMIDKQLTSRSRHVECRPIAPSASLLSARVNIAADPSQPPAGSLDAWLLERYRLFVGLADGRLLAADVEHPPWTASPIGLSDFHNSLCGMLGLSLPLAPAQAHYSSGVAARFRAFRVVAARTSAASALPARLASRSRSFDPGVSPSFSRQTASHTPGRRGYPPRSLPR